MQGPVAKAKGEPTELETSELRQSHLAVRRQLRKKKKTKAAREYGAPISDLEHMRGRGGTDMTAGIKGSGLGRPPSKKYIPHGRGERLGVRSGCPSDGVATRSDVRKSFGSPQS